MDKNVLVLSAISGDQESFQRVYERLKMYAYSIASELYSDSVLREDAVNQAMDGVVDKIRNQRGLFENKPWSYVKRSVSNSLIDLARLREASKSKEENEESSKSYEKPLDPKELTWIDEGFARITENGDNNSGFRIFKISEVPQNKDQAEKKSKSYPWIDTLEEVLTYQWWWGIEQWEENESKNLSTKQSLAVEDLAFRFKYCSAKMWAKWNLINGLIDNIASHKEKHIMLQHLSGFKQIEIAKKQNVSEPYVSKVLSKYHKDWGWNDDDMSQAKLMLVSKHLADWYAAPKKYVPPQSPLYDRYNPKLDELHRKLNKAQDDYEKEFTKINPGWEIRQYDYEEDFEEKIGYKIQDDWIRKVRRYGFRPALKMLGGRNPIDTYWKSLEAQYANIKTSLELKDFESEIDKLRIEIHCVIHPEFVNYLKALQDKQKAVCTENDELEPRKQKYWDSFSEFRGSLTVNFPLTREESEEFEDLKRQWQIEQKIKAKMQETIIKAASEFEQKKSEFYKTVIASPKMKAYFHDLDLTDIIQLNRLFHIAEAFFRSWYPNLRLSENPDYGTWSNYPLRTDYS
jgi:DNA-directed RNA polymerase specialized sigma24 family protein